MKVLFKRLLVASIVLWIAPAPAVAEVLCEEDEAFMGLGITPHKQCISEHLPEFSDYENIYQECRLIVYLTDLADKDAEQEKLEPAYRQAAQHVKSCWTDREPMLEFRLAKYPYSSFAEWEILADKQLREALGEDQRGVIFSDQRIFIYVVTDAAMAKAIKFLADNGVPDDAYDIDSREAEIRRMPSIAPIKRRTDQGEQYLLPAFFATGEKGGDLVLGHTTMNEAVQTLPPWPGHGPSEGPLAPQSERSPWISEKVHSTLDRIAYTYNPARIYLMITFDKSERMISAHYEVQEGQEKLLIKALSELASLEEIHREKRGFVQRGEIGSCITVETNTARMSDGQYRLTAVHYFYTCES